MPAPPAYANWGGWGSKETPEGKALHSTAQSSGGGVTKAPMRMRRNLQGGSGVPAASGRLLPAVPVYATGLILQFWLCCYLNPEY